MEIRPTFGDSVWWIPVRSPGTGEESPDPRVGRESEDQWEERYGVSV